MGVKSYDSVQKSHESSLLWAFQELPWLKSHKPKTQYQHPWYFGFRRTVFVHPGVIMSLTTDPRETDQARRYVFQTLAYDWFCRKKAIND